MVAVDGTTKNAPPLPAGGNGDAVLPATNNGPTTAVELSCRRSLATSTVKLSRRRSPATSTIGSSLLCRHLLLSTSAVPSSPYPRLSRAWADNGDQIIAPPLPREVHDRVVPPPPAPPPVDVRGPVLAAPPLVTCILRACALLAAPSSHGHANPVVSAVAVVFVATALWGGNIMARPRREGKGHGAVKELPFWSLEFVISVSRVARSILGLPVASAGGRGWRGLVIAMIEFSGACVAPALAWAALGALVALRYNGLFCPVGEISS
jgi:hypothetical protein